MSLESLTEPPMGRPLIYSSGKGRSFLSSALAVPLLIGRNVSCPDLRQEVDQEERVEHERSRLRTLQALSASSTDMVDFASSGTGGDREAIGGTGSNGPNVGLHLQPPELRVDLGSMESLLADDDFCSTPSPSPLIDCSRSSSELSIRKLGHENTLLRTSLRRRRGSNPVVPSTGSVAASAVGAPTPEITVSDHSAKRAPTLSLSGSVPTLVAATTGTPFPGGHSNNNYNNNNNNSNYNNNSSSSIIYNNSSTANCTPLLLSYTGSRNDPMSSTTVDHNGGTGSGVDRTDDSGGSSRLARATAATEDDGGGDDDTSALHSSEQAKLLWKLSKLAKRWYHQLREDFSEIRPFEIEDKPLFEVEETFSIKTTTDALNRFDDLFAALVDGPLRDAYNEALRLTQWTYPLQTLLTLVVLLHSLWTEYLVTLILIALCVSLLRNYLIAQGWIIEKNRMDIDSRRRPNAVRVTNLFQLNMRVTKSFNILTELLDKGLALWTWKRPEITGILFGALVGGALLSIIAPTGFLLKLLGTAVLAKIFLLDYIFFRFPRVRAKYDYFYIWYHELPTGKDLERQRKFHKSLKISKSTNDLTSMRSTFDPSVLRKLEEKLSNLFELNSVESLVTGWELGKRCTLINKDRALTGAFKSGRLFLTEKHLLFMRYKTQSPKNISIALENIIRVEKGKHSGWLPGDAQTLEVVTDHGITLTFGALTDRDEVHREVLIHVAQHAYKRKTRSRAMT